jgi:hypothetical protein
MDTAPRRENCMCASKGNVGTNYKGLRIKDLLCSFAWIIERNVPE